MLRLNSRHLKAVAQKQFSFPGFVFFYFLVNCFKMLFFVANFRVNLRYFNNTFCSLRQVDMTI